MKIIKNSLFIALLMMLTIMFIPNISAGGEASYQIKGVNANGTITYGYEVYVLMSDLNSNVDDFETDYGTTAKAYWNVGGVEEEANLISGKFSYTPTSKDIGKKVYFRTESINNVKQSQNTETSRHSVVGKVNVTINNVDKNGYMKITGSTTKDGVNISNLRIDGGAIVEPIDDSSFIYNLYTKDLNIGWHELSFSFDDYSAGSNPISFKIPITAAPSNKTSYVKTYNKCLIYKVGYIANSEDYDGLFLRIKKTSDKSWGNKIRGPYTSNQEIAFCGLSPNTKYQVKVLYIKNFNKKTQITGPDSKVITVKTGVNSKPSVKSIKISKAKVKKKYYSSRVWWDAGGVMHYIQGHYSYTTSYKVTVKLKKKPGTKGIYIDGKKVKGNKKTYTAKFTSSGNLKGKKIPIEVKSYNDDTYGAYSAVYTKKVKVK